MGSAVEKNQEPSLYPSLEQLSGAGRGRVFYLDQSRITIGRAETNHVVVVDDSVSREHAVIEKGDDGAFVVFDNQSRNGILVNGKKVEASVIESNDQVSIGTVLFRFLVPSEKFESESGAAESSGAPMLPGKKKFQLNRRVLLYGGAGLVLAAVLLMDKGTPQQSDAKKTKPEDPNANPTVVVSEAPTPPKMTDSPKQEVIDLTKNPVESSLEQLSQNDISVADSETHFRRGQREYFNKNYHRAINSFELALSLNRNHPVAGYYLKAAIHEAEEEAKKNYEMGMKYFESLQYQRAIYHFQQTQNLLSHRPQDPVISKAEEYIRLSRQRLQAAEMFP
ncbi:MAG: FHA domain-containing protein [Proteobacteria bacterium]|nr:FHA domain-containing protein [Pseudomonadota bacterium]